MTIDTRLADAGKAVDTDWYTLMPTEVAAKLWVDPSKGIPAARASELLTASGPNALPEEKPTPRWRRSC